MTRFDVYHVLTSTPHAVALMVDFGHFTPDTETCLNSLTPIYKTPLTSQQASMKPATPTARVHVHATLSINKPAHLYVVSAKVLEGTVQPGMFARIPLNSSFFLTVRISSVTPILNDFDIPLLGLVFEEDERFNLLEALNIGDETWNITTEGEE